MRGRVSKLLGKRRLVTGYESEDLLRDLRVRTSDVLRGEPIIFELDGRQLSAYEGESIAAAAISAGIRTLRLAPRTNEPRGVYCGMGVCFDCLVIIDGMPNQRACMTEVSPGMRVQRQSGWDG
jgi:hypothetical protein